jgi:hypothetical protein
VVIGGGILEWSGRIGQSPFIQTLLVMNHKAFEEFIGRIGLELAKNN